MTTAITPETAAGPLTLPVESSDLRAFRSADSVVFRLRNGQATIEANRDGRNTPDGFDQKVVIYAGGERVTDYTRSGDDDGYAMGNRRNGGNGYTGFVMFHSGPKYSDTLATLVRAIAKGDTVRLDWTRANNNDNTRAVGYNRDELRLRVCKPATKANPRGREDVYLVAVETGPDNSARMVRAN